MAVYVYNPPSSAEAVSFVAGSLTNPEKAVSRFFWSYTDKADLHSLMKKTLDEMDEEERNCWSYGKYLLRIHPGDYIAHVNVPEYGKVTVGRVVSEYYFDKIMPFGDGNQCFDVEDVFTFDRNDPLIHPMVSARLKLQGAHWQMYCEKEFFDSLARVKSNPEDTASFMDKELHGVFSSLAETIQRNHPGKSLEGFIAKVFRNVPGVIDVKENGSGFKSDYGADLLVRYKNGIADFGSEEIMVVQVKSYEGEIWNTEAAEQIQTALSYFGASSGVIITTAKSTPAIEEAIASAEQEAGKPIYLMTCEDLARFVLIYGMDLL